MTNKELLLLIRLICYGWGGGLGRGVGGFLMDHTVFRGNSRLSRLKQSLKEGLYNIDFQLPCNGGLGEHKN